MNQNIHIVEDLLDKTVEKLNKDVNCGIVICTGPADTEEEKQNIIELQSLAVNLYIGVTHDKVLRALERLEDEMESSIK